MYKTIRIQNWSQLRSIADHLILWGFRGQENSSWPLETTLQRAASLYNHPADMLWHREYWMIRQFHRRAHHYCKDLPAYDKKLSWLALMQHFGAPSRLLDFSHSIYIAAFFAFERAIGDVAIWGVNLAGISEIVAKLLGHNLSTENIDMTNTRHIGIANQYISSDGKQVESPTSLILNVEPEQLHERLLVQQGLFLFQTDISIGFEKAFSNFMTSANYEVMSEEIIWDDKGTRLTDILNSLLIKIIVPKHVILHAIFDLNKMNISAATLFPGLDGFGRSMWYSFTSFPLRNDNSK